MAHNRITAVLFDWDFTLAYTIGENVPFSERLTLLFQQHGVSTTAAEMTAALQSVQQDIRAGKADGVVSPQKKREIMQNYRLLLQKLGHRDTSYDFAEQLYSGYAYLPHYLYADVLPTLYKLYQAGLKLGILSNHSMSARPVMEELVGTYIPGQYITVSEDIGIHKPNSTIFWLAAAKMRTPPGSCIYVGDNLEVDAIAAVQQGEYAQGLWLNREKRPFTLPLASNVAQIQSLTQALDFLL